MDLQYRTSILINIYMFFSTGTTGIIQWQEWIEDTSIVDSFSTSGLIASKTTLTPAKCILECYQLPECEMVGFGDTNGICDLYNIVISAQSTLTFQKSTTFYKARCRQLGYTYLKALSICLKISNSQANFTAARAACQADGGDLLMLKSDALSHYLESILHESTSQYWIGATQDPGDDQTFYWIDNTPFPERLWYAGEPNVSSEECVQIRFFHDAGSLTVHDCPCSWLLNYICEQT